MDQKLKNEALEFARSANVSVLATVSKEKQVNARVMQNARIDDDFTIWYVTDSPSNKAVELSKNLQVCVVMSNYRIRKDIRYYGKVFILTDQKLKDEFWKECYSTFFKGGKEDIAYVILKFVPDEIEYRDTTKYGHFAKKLK